jgi:anaphase-promoting complex subunit 8
MNTPVSQPQAQQQQQGQVDVQWDPNEIRRTLKHAIMQLSHHCLKLSSKWACEQLIGLPESIDGDELEDDAGASTVTIQTPTSKELYSKSLLELGEYAHAAAILSQPASHVTVLAPPLPNLTSYGIYLRAYSMYLAGEQRKHQEALEWKGGNNSGEAAAAGDPQTTQSQQQNASHKNPFLKQLSDELANHYEHEQLDAFGLYVYGMVLKELLPTRGHHDAFAILVESIRQFPYNWSAWLDLAHVVSSSSSSSSSKQKAAQEEQQDELTREFASHFMYHFYTAHVYLQKQQSHEAAIQVYERLVQPNMDDPSSQQQPALLFAGSPYVASQLAVAHYHLREFHLAQHCFAQLVQRDPYRLDELDIYSNILYVQDSAMLLSQLAHTAMRVDKYRPETCCIVGNYYSLKQLRTKAIQYFQRALKLNPNYTGAWTLMGHEYVELKNTPAAMEAYRKAADVEPNDYRAWYGLGQAYEILSMPLYALYYYKRATAVRPYDARMWCAVAHCYLLLGKRKEALLSYETALTDDVEGLATTQLAQLYQDDGRHDKAAQCYIKHLELRYLATTAHPNTTASASLPDVLSGVAVQATEARALLFLAQYYLTNATKDNLETAALCASRLLEYPGPEKEEGKAVLRDIRSRRGGDS